jgi:hypothetical protein
LAIAAAVPTTPIFADAFDAQWIDHFVTCIDENDFDIGNVEPLKTSASWLNNSNNI